MKRYAFDDQMRSMTRDKVRVAARRERPSRDLFMPTMITCSVALVLFVGAVLIKLGSFSAPRSISEQPPAVESSLATR